MRVLYVGEVMGKGRMKDEQNVRDGKQERDGIVNERRREVGRKTRGMCVRNFNVIIKFCWKVGDDKVERRQTRTGLRRRT